MTRKTQQLPVLPRGMGSYDYDVNGNVRYRKLVTENGRRKQLSCSGKTVKEANEKMKIAEDNFRKNVKAKDKEERTEILSDAMGKWLVAYKQPSVSPRSFDRLESIFNTHIKDSRLGRMQTSAITNDDIQKFMSELKNGKNDNELSYSTKKKIFEELGQYFNHRFLKNPSDNPMIGVTRPVNTGKQKDESLIIYDDNEIKKFCEEAKKVYNPGKSGGYKNGLLYIFLLFIYCRIGEAQALQWKDIDFKNRTVTINKALARIKNRNRKEGETAYLNKISTTKNKLSRTVYMSDPALQAITEYKERVNPTSDEHYIFDNGAGEITWLTNIDHTYKRIVKAAKLDYKNVTIHGLRHTGISYMIRHGVPIEVVSRMAGHQSITITQEIYYQILEEQKIKAMKDFDKIKFTF